MVTEVVAGKKSSCSHFDKSVLICLDFSLEKVKGLEKSSLNKQSNVLSVWNGK